MKTLPVSLKKISVSEYYPQLDQVKVCIIIDDGKEKAFVKQLKIENPALHAKEWIKEIRAKLKETHKVHTLEDDPLAGVLILKFNQEEDVLEEKIARFLSQLAEKIRSAKLAKLSYYDLEKKITGTSLVL